MAVAVGVVAVVESSVHERVPSRPDLGLLEFLRELLWRRLPSEPDAASREVRRRLDWTVEHELPERRARGSDAADLDALAAVTASSSPATAFVVDVVRRSRLDLRHGCELFSGRRPDVLRLRDRLQELTAE